MSSDIIMPINISPYPCLLDWINVENTKTEGTECRNEVTIIDSNIMVRRKAFLTQVLYFPSKHHQPKGVTKTKKND